MEEFIMQAVVSNTKLTPWGNSQGVRLQKEVLKRTDYKDGQEFAVYVEEGRIVLQPIVSETANKLPETLDELIAGYKYDGYHAEEIDWGDAQGAELQW